MNIEAINAELSRIGYRAVKMTKPKRKAASVAEWKPRTQGGRRAKAAMQFWAKHPKAVGVTSYQVRGQDGQWYETWMDGFSDAVAFQKAEFAKWRHKGSRRSETETE